MNASPQSHLKLSDVDVDVDDDATRCSCVSILKNKGDGEIIGTRDF